MSPLADTPCYRLDECSGPDIRLNTLPCNAKRLKGARPGMWPKLSLRVRPPSIAKLHYEEPLSDDDDLCEAQRFL